MSILSKSRRANRSRRLPPLVAIGWLLLTQPATASTLQHATVVDKGNSIKLVLTLDAAGAGARAFELKAPRRVVIDLPGTTTAPSTRAGVAGVLRVRTGQLDRATARVVLDLAQAMKFELAGADTNRIVVTLRPSSASGVPSMQDERPRIEPEAVLPPGPTREAPPLHPGTQGASGRAAFVDRILAARLNGHLLSEGELFLFDDAGRLYAPKATVAGWRLRLPGNHETRYRGVPYLLLSGVPGLGIRVDETLVELTAAPGLFAPTSVSASGIVAPPTPSTVSGTFLNYSLFAEGISGAWTTSAALEASAFSKLGAFLGRFVVRQSNGRVRATRLDTTWTIDRPLSMSSVRIGDAISNPGVGGTPLRFAGVQFARNFETRPGFITMPLPTLAGDAAVPSVVDVFVDGNLRLSQELGPGSFEISDVPVAAGAGSIRTVIRDVLGRSVVADLPYYASPLALRRGLHDFSYEAGFLREAYAAKSAAYGPPFVSATHRLGVSDRLTLEGHVSFTSGHQMAASSAVVVLPGSGVASAGLAGSNDSSGVSAFVSFESRSASRSAGIRYEEQSSGFAQPGQASRSEGRRSTLQLYTDVHTRVGSIGAQYLRRRSKKFGSEDLVTVSSSIGIGPLGSLQLFAQRAIFEDTSTTLGLNLVVPLGARFTTSTSAQLIDGRWQGTTSIQKDPPTSTGIGYRARLSSGRIDTASAQLSMRAEHFSADAELTMLGSRGGGRLFMSGGLGIIDGEFFASRDIGESFAVVSVGGQPGVRVYAENQVVGVTGADGRVVVPRLRAYEDNLISIEPADVSLDYDLADVERVIRPHDRSGVAIDFAVNRKTAAILKIELDDGRPLPAGAHVRLSDGMVVLATEAGEVVIMNVDMAQPEAASWGDGACKIMQQPTAGAMLASGATLRCRAKPFVAASQASAAAGGLGANR